VEKVAAGPLAGDDTVMGIPGLLYPSFSADNRSYAVDIEFCAVADTNGRAVVTYCGETPTAGISNFFRLEWAGGWCLGHVIGPHDFTLYCFIKHDPLERAAWQMVEAAGV
jgi:hypothetical protein